MVLGFGAINWARASHLYSDSTKPLKKLTCRGAERRGPVPSALGPSIRNAAASANGSEDASASLKGCEDDLISPAAPFPCSAPGRICIWPVLLEARSRQVLPPAACSCSSCRVLTRVLYWLTGSAEGAGGNVVHGCSEGVLALLTLSVAVLMIHQG